jgi:hypothetical protein
MVEPEDPSVISCSRLFVGLFALSLLSSCTSHMPMQDRVPAGQSPIEWAVGCRAGEDGFASNCVATADSPPYVLRLSTADSQLSVSILHPECEEARQFDRVDVIGLTSRRRAALVAEAFADAAAALQGRCPHLPRPVPELDHAPDISIIGDPD